MNKTWTYACTDCGLAVNTKTFSQKSGKFEVSEWDEVEWLIAC